MCAASTALIPGAGRAFVPVEPLDRRVAFTLTVNFPASLIIEYLFCLQSSIDEHRCCCSRLAKASSFRLSMPVVGTWQFAVTTEWDEIPGY